MTDCWIAMGGNVGDVADTFERALHTLGKHAGVAVITRSRNYSTSPVGTHAGDRFINAAAQLTACCGPVELLDSLQAVESRLGRIRETRWGPRTLDLDLLFYGQRIMSTERLRLPHPHLWYRRFVLDPLTEIAPDLIHPDQGITISQLRQQLLVRPLKCLLFGGETAERLALQHEMARQFPETEWQDTASESTCLAFDLDSVVETPGSLTVQSKRVIRLGSFPTPFPESLRDVLAAAIQSAEPID